jgi:hypothetical protein
MMLLAKFHQQFPTSKYLLRPIVVPISIIKFINIRNPFSQHHHDRLPRLRLMRPVLTQINEMLNFLFNVGNEFDAHLVAEVEKTLPPHLLLVHQYMLYRQNVYVLGSVSIWMLINIITQKDYQPRPIGWPTSASEILILAATRTRTSRS